MGLFLDLKGAQAGTAANYICMKMCRVPSEVSAQMFVRTAFTFVALIIIIILSGCDTWAGSETSDVTRRKDEAFRLPALISGL